MAGGAHRLCTEGLASAGIPGLVRGDSKERKPPNQSGCPDPLLLEPNFVPTAQSFPSVRQPPSMVEPVSATILAAGLAAKKSDGWQRRLSSKAAER